MELATLLPEKFLQKSPHTLTLITTYRCNAACKECCFESNPSLTSRLSWEELEKGITEAYASFDNLKLVSLAAVSVSC